MMGFSCMSVIINIIVELVYIYLRNEINYFIGGKNSIRSLGPNFWFPTIEDFVSYGPICCHWVKELYDKVSI